MQAKRSPDSSRKPGEAMCAGFVPYLARIAGKMFGKALPVLLPKAK